MNPFLTFADPDAAKAAHERLKGLPSQRHTMEAALLKQQQARLAKGLPVYEDNEEDAANDSGEAERARPTSKKKAA